MCNEAKVLSIPICMSCGSTRVVLDAWACWDPEIELWVLEQEFDAAFCHDCEEDTKLEWKVHKLKE
jgi:hypothetical protein